VNDPSQQDLLGYVLGALDAQEQRELQKQIDNDPALEESLLDIKAALVPLDSIDNKGYRPGLARRTCEAVANWDAESAASRLAFLDHTEIDWEEGCELPSSQPAPADAVEPTTVENKPSPAGESIAPESSGTETLSAAGSAVPSFTI